MSALGAFVQSALDAFKESALNARGSGGEPDEYQYWIAIENTVGAFFAYAYNDEFDVWINVAAPSEVGLDAGPHRKLLWHDGELWISGESSIARSMDSERAAQFGSVAGDDFVSDVVVFGSDLLIWAAEGSLGVGHGIYKYVPATDAWAIDTENFNTHSGTPGRGGFATLSGTLYVGGGPPNTFSIEDRGGASGDPIVPSDQNTPIVKMGGYTTNPGVGGATLGSKIIWSGFGMADDLDSDADTAYKTTLIEFTGTEVSVDEIDDTKISGQYKWQTSETISAIVNVDGTVYAAGAEWNGSSRDEGLLETGGASVSMPLTCTTGEVLALAARGTDVMIGGDFSDFDENTGAAIAKLAFFDGTTVTAWPNAAPPANVAITAVLAVLRTTNDPEITNPGVQSADDSPNWTLAMSGTDITKWRLQDDDGATGMTIDTSTGVLSWASPTPKIGFFPRYRIAVYAGNAQYFDSIDFELWIASVAPIITAIGAETQASGVAYNEIHGLDAGDGYIEYSIVSEDVPAGSVVSVIPWGIARTQFRVTVSPAPVDGTYNITVRATNPEGFDDEAFTIEWS